MPRATRAKAGNSASPDRAPEASGRNAQADGRLSYVKPPQLMSSFLDFHGSANEKRTRS
jgi:hypothetical protein